MAKGLILVFLIVLSCSLVASQTTPTAPPCTPDKCLSSVTSRCIPTSVSHCSTSGGSCSAATNCLQQVSHALGVTCTSGVCSFGGTCKTGFLDCDGNTANGCETSQLKISTLTAPYAGTDTNQFKDTIIPTFGQVFTTPCSGVSALKSFLFYTREPVNLNFKLELFEFSYTITTGTFGSGNVVGLALFTSKIEHTKTEPAPGGHTLVAIHPTTPIPVTPGTTYIAIMTLEGANDPASVVGLAQFAVGVAGLPIAFQTAGTPNEITNAGWRIQENYSLVFTAQFQ